MIVIFLLHVFQSVEKELMFKFFGSNQYEHIGDKTQPNQTIQMENSIFTEK